MSTPEGGKKWTWRRLLVQGVVFAVGVGLFAWCVHIAARPENREHLLRVVHAPWTTLATLAGLSLATLFINGATFWTAIGPVRKVPFVDIQATNAGAALLNYVPFKVGVMLRFLVHNRRNGVPVMTVAAWLGAVGLTMMTALVPLVLAAVWRKRMDAGFFAALAAGVAGCWCVLLLTASYFAHERGLQRCYALAGKLRIRLLDKGLRTRAFANVHEGFGMLAHPAWLGAGVLLRVLDLLVHGARFMVVAELVGGMEFGFDGWLLISSTYFLISVVSPAGAIGAREGAATGVAAALGLEGFDVNAFVSVVLTVTASEMVVNLVCGPVGLWWVRVDRLLQGRKKPAG